MRTGLRVLLLWMISMPIFSQKKNARYLMHIHHSSGPIRIDGVLDEPSWNQAETADNFFMIPPMDLSRYELFYPEKRQFFLENGDQFNNFGYSDIQPSFTAHRPGCSD